MTTPSSVPAQGEAMEVLRLARRALGYAEAWDEKGAKEVEDAITAIDRALVAASPCAAQPEPITPAKLARAADRKALPIIRALNVFGGNVTVNQPLDLALIGAALSHAGCGLSAAAQGGQQPVAEWQWRQWWNGDGGEPMGWGDWQRVKPRNRLQSLDEAVQEMRDFIAQGCRYELRPLYTAPAPAAPLTRKKILAIAATFATFDDIDADTILEPFARAIEAAHGITLAGTAQKESADGASVVGD